MIREIKKVLSASKWMRFSLEFARGTWTAVFFHEKGIVYGRASSGDAREAVKEAMREGLKNSKHLVRQ